MAWRWPRIGEELKGVHLLVGEGSRSWVPDHDRADLPTEIAFGEKVSQPFHLWVAHVLARSRKMRERLFQVLEVHPTPLAQHDQFVLLPHAGREGLLDD